MDVEPKDGGWVRRAAWPVSVLAHLMIALLIAFPISLPEPEKEQAIDVELVPPPRPPEQAKKELKPAPAKPAPQPEKPEPKTPEKAEAKPSPKRDAPAPSARMPALERVFRYGEKDAGPRQSPAGNNAENGGAQEAPEADAPAAASVKPAAETPSAPADATAQRESSPAPDQTPGGIPDGKGAGDKATPPQTLGAASRPEESQRPPAVTEASRDAALPKPSSPPTPKPAKAAGAPAAKSGDARKQFSRQATGDPVATTAMDGVPRRVRGGRLCAAELRERLLSGSPPYFPDLLPTYPLDSGVVLQVTKGAIRVGGEWRGLSFRCEVDPDATRVVGFDFRVGDFLERSELERRGLPLQ